MDLALGLISGLGIGSLIGSLVTLFWQSRIERQTESRAARRVLYVELMTLLKNRHRTTDRFLWDPGSPPEDFGDDRIDELNALLDIDATPKVRELAGDCFSELQKFWVSATMGAPLTVDEHGLFEYHFDRMHELGDDDHAKATVMRVHLGAVHDEYSAAVDKLGAQVRKELHGGKGD